VPAAADASGVSKYYNNQSESIFKRRTWSKKQFKAALNQQAAATTGQSAKAGQAAQANEASAGNTSMGGGMGIGIKSYEASLDDRRAQQLNEHNMSRD